MLDLQVARSSIELMLNLEVARSSIGLMLNLQAARSSIGLMLNLEVDRSSIGLMLNLQVARSSIGFKLYATYVLRILLIIGRNSTHCVLAYCCHRCVYTCLYASFVDRKKRV